MTPRLTPSFVVAVLALVVATGGVGYAAGRIGSAQIKNNSIQSQDIRNNTVTTRDVRNGTLTGADVRKGSLGRSTDYTRCRAGELFVFGACARRTPYGPTSYQAAMSNCSDLGGRLPTIQELRYITIHDEFTWADGNPAQYEFSSTWNTSPTMYPMAVDRNFNAFGDASMSLFRYHCLTLR